MRHKTNRELFEQLEAMGADADSSGSLHPDGSVAAPTANWSCKVCGWYGLNLPIAEVTHRHYIWNHHQKKWCPGTPIVEVEKPQNDELCEPPTRDAARDSGTECANGGSQQ